MKRDNRYWGMTVEACERELKQKRHFLNCQKQALARQKSKHQRSRTTEILIASLTTLVNQLEEVIKSKAKQTTLF